MALSPEEFVRKYLEAYKNGKTTAEFAKELEITETSVTSRVRTYRIRGMLS